MDPNTQVSRLEDVETLKQDIASTLNNTAAITVYIQKQIAAGDATYKFR
jgi:hypothetical protein